MINRILMKNLALVILFFAVNHLSAQTDFVMPNLSDLDSLAVAKDTTTVQQSIATVVDTIVVDTAQPSAVSQESVSDESVSTSVGYQSASSQESWISNGWDLGASAGLSSVVGDISSKDKPSMRIVGIFNIQKELFPLVQLRGQLAFGQLAGVKPKFNSGADANLSFSTNMIEYNGSLKFNLTDAFMPDSKLGLYVSAGLGFIHFNSSSYNTLNNSVIYNTGKTIELVAPVGAGLEYKFSEFFVGNIDVTTRWAANDKVDATHVSKSFNDFYVLSTVGISYKIGSIKKNQKQQEMQCVERVKSSAQAAETATIAKVAEQFAADSAVIAQKSAQIDSLETVITTLQSTVAAQAANASASPTSKSVVAPVAPAKTPAVVNTTTTQVASSTVSVEGGSIEVPGVTYRVQILAVQNSKDIKLSQLKSQYSITETIYEEYLENFYKFTVGQYTTLDKALQYRESLVAKGVQGAFIVAYNNGKRISNAEAKNLREGIK